MSVRVAWSAPGDGGSAITGYTVQRRVGVGTWSDLGTTSSTTLAYVDSTASTGTQYGYRVAASNSVGIGAYSSEATITPAGVVSSTWGTSYVKLSNIATTAAPSGGVSGMVMSALHQNVMYVCEDHGSNKVYMVNPRTGAHLATITLTGASVVDWEDMTRGPNNTIVVGDIGGNSATRTTFYLYSFPEPSTIANITLTPTVYPMTYSDGGQHNPESLLWDPTTNRFYVHTKYNSSFGETRSLWCESAVGLSTSGNVFTITSRVHNSSNPQRWAFAGDWDPDGSRYLLQYGSQGGATAPVQVYNRDGTFSKEVLFNTADLAQPESACWVPEGTGILISTEGTSPPIYYIPCS